MNLAISHALLACQRMPHVPLAGLQVADEAPGLDEQLARQQCQQQVIVAIGQLPVRRRQVLLLRMVHELSHRQIVQRCGISQTTVEKHLARAHAAIRRWVNSE